MSWFNEVTGTNDYERQSWRDNFNGGRAAGDLTGATNARLDAERDAFQGTTWTGSSSQPSALQLARSMVGPGNQSVRIGQGSTGGGAGNEVVTQGPVIPGKPAGGKGSGSRLTISGPLADALIPKDKRLERIGDGGAFESYGAISDRGWVNTGSGWQPVPSSDIKERIEDNFIMESLWFGRNYLAPMFVEGLEDGVRPPFLDPEYSHYVPGFNEWREGGAPRRGSDGVQVFTGGGF